MNVETITEIIKESQQKFFSEDVSNLVTWRDM